MKKIYLLSLLVVSCMLPALSQVQLTQYFLDGTLYNPSFAGVTDSIFINAIGRLQWIGLKDANSHNISPLSVVANFSTPLNGINSGIGLNVIYNEVGFETGIQGKINYNYGFKFKNKLKRLRIGVAVSFMSKSVDYSQLVPENETDPLLKIKSKESGLIPDFDLGLLYNHTKKWYVGASGTNLLESSTNIGNVTYSQDRTLYLTAGVYIRLSPKKSKPLYLVPSLLVKSNLENVQFDVNARVEYNDLFWAGLSYRYQDAVTAMAGIEAGGFMLGLSYDYTIGSLSGASNGSAEVFLGYRFHPDQKNKKIREVKLNSLYNTRYL